MFDKLKETVKRNKETVLAIIAIFAILAIICFIFKDIISAFVLILALVALLCSDNINLYIHQLLSEKEQKQALVAQQTQIIQTTIADVLFRGLTGQLGKLLGAIPPQTVQDIYPTSIPPIQEFNGVTTYRFTAHLTPGSQPMSEDVMKRVINGYFKKVSLSGLLPPKPGSTFHPYFQTVAVTLDIVLPNTIIFYVVYVDDLFAEDYLYNRMCEEAEEWRRKLVDTQPPDDEEF